TLTPMMCSQLFRARRGQPSWIGRLLDRGLHGLIAGYGRVLRLVLRHRGVIGFITFTTIATAVWLYVDMPKGMFPQQDTGMLIGSTLAPQDISFPAMKERQQKVMQIVLSDPDVSHVIGNVGGFGSSAVNTGSMFIALKDKPERKISADEVIAR